MLKEQQWATALSLLSCLASVQAYAADASKYPSNRYEPATVSAVPKATINAAADSQKTKSEEQAVSAPATAEKTQLTTKPAGTAASNTAIPVEQSPAAPLDIQNLKPKRTVGTTAAAIANKPSGKTETVAKPPAESVTSATRASVKEKPAQAPSQAVTPTSPSGVAAKPAEKSATTAKPSIEPAKTAASASAKDKASPDPSLAVTPSSPASAAAKPAEKPAGKTETAAKASAESIKALPGIGVKAETKTVPAAESHTAAAKPEIPLKPSVEAETAKKHSGSGEEKTISASISEPQPLSLVETILSIPLLGLFLLVLIKGGLLKPHE